MEDPEASGTLQNQIPTHPEMFCLDTVTCISGTNTNTRQRKTNTTNRNLSICVTCAHISELRFVYFQPIHLLLQSNQS